MSVQCDITQVRLTEADVLVKVFNLNLNENSTKISELESALTSNGIDTVKKHCENLRKDVQAATNLRIEAINDLNTFFIKKINDYEKDCLTNIGKLNISKMNLIY